MSFYGLVATLAAFDVRPPAFDARKVTNGGALHWDGS